MNTLSKLFFACCIATGHAAVAQDGSAERPLYFPNKTQWKAIDPKEAGWDEAKLKQALDLAKNAKSSGVVILLNGKILAEGHWTPKSTSFRYRNTRNGKSSAGHQIEDVASCQKSIVSVMIGIAQEKKLLRLEDIASKYLGEGWSKASREQEAKITIRHLITMTSGLNDGLRYEAPPGSKWRYNTGAYSQCLQVVCKATGKDENTITKEWITNPLGMTDSKWVPRSGLGPNKFGFATTARDLARFGLMVQAGGKWNQRTIIGDESYLKASLTASQKLNPSYGYLWWLNQSKTKKPIIPSAPRDLVGAFGALGRKCYVAPSIGLVVTRLGDQPSNARKFQNDFWQLLTDSAPKQR